VFGHVWAPLPVRGLQLGGKEWRYCEACRAYRSV
jgi:hypothetical protein